VVSVAASDAFIHQAVLFAFAQARLPAPISREFALILVASKTALGCAGECLTGTKILLLNRQDFAFPIELLVRC
jgi:hypothetical protein